jgi:SAM-dependent methyltransferase
MSDQAHFWSQAAARYEQEFVDPYRDTADNPLLAALGSIETPAAKTAADLGCGIGPLLPNLAERFARVIAVDFAPGMLARTRERCAHFANIEFHASSLTNLAPLAGRVDVAVAVNSIIQPDVSAIEKVLSSVRAILKPGGLFLGILPAMDAVHYHTMLLVDRARRTGMPEDKARDNAAGHAEHQLYGFAFGDFSYLGLRQHFWQPFEIGYRLRRAGFRNIRRSKALLSWDQCACGADLRGHPPPWDWFFSCRKPED